jgi:hypothetical protein
LLVAGSVRRREQAMLTTSLLALPFGEEGSQAGQPLLAAEQQILRRQRVGQFLESLGMAAFQKSVRALLKGDACLAQLMG